MPASTQSAVLWQSPTTQAPETQILPVPQSASSTPSVHTEQLPFLQTGVEPEHCVDAVQAPLPPEDVPAPEVDPLAAVAVPAPAAPVVPV